VSVFLKTSTATLPRLTISSADVSGNAYFNFSTGLPESITTGFAADMLALDSGWYRCSITFTSITAVATNTFLVVDDSSNLVMWSWGAQFESSVSTAITVAPSSYIATTTTSATRTADSVSMPTLNNFVAAPFSIFVRANVGAFTGTARMVINIPVAAGFIFLYFDGASNSVAFRYDTGTSNTISVAFTPDSDISIVAKIDGSNLTLDVDGTTSTAAITTTPALTISGTATLGSRSSSEYLNDNLVDLRVYDFSLNDDETTYLQGV